MKAATAIVSFGLLFAAGCGINHAPVDEEGGPSNDPTEDQQVDLGDGAMGLSASDVGMQLISPVDLNGSYKVTRTYNQVTHINYAKNVVHWDFMQDAFALDFSEGCGASWMNPIVAAASGTVRIPDWDAGYGAHHVFIDHDNQCRTHYGHLEQRVVTEGQYVRQGQLIGYEGNEGNVEGECGTTATKGTHLHFVLMCFNDLTDLFEATKAEPLSGLSDFTNGMNLNPKAAIQANLPVGTLMQELGDPAIYLVCAEGKKCHFGDWLSFTQRRMFHESNQPDGEVIQVSPGTLGCYEDGDAISGSVSMKLVSCSEYNVMTFNHGGKLVRRRIPFAASSDRYAPLLKSWGFAPSEIRTGGAIECGLSPVEFSQPLRMRPGTLLEEASDNDFWVVTSDKYVASDAELQTGRTVLRRVMRAENGRPLMPLLYRTYETVIQIPDGSARDFVNGGVSTPFDVAQATKCNGTFGTGGSHPPPAPPAPEPTPSACTEGQRRCVSSVIVSVCSVDVAGNPYWSDGECREGFACSSSTKQCERVSTPNPDPEPPPAPPAPPEVPALTVQCTLLSDGRLQVTAGGPFTSGLVGGTVPAMTQLQYGSDTDNWNVPYASGKPSVACTSSASQCTLTLAANVDGFNLFASDGRGGKWADLTDADGDGKRMDVTGDCRLAGTKIVRGASAPPPPPPTPTASPTIECVATSGALVLNVTNVSAAGLMQAAGVSEASLIALSASGDAVGWGVSSASPYAADYASAVALSFPSTLRRFNLWAMSDAGTAYWFDLNTWTATGDCRIVDDGAGGKVIVR